MNTWLKACLAGSLLFTPVAFAQSADDDDPYAYPEQEAERAQEKAQKDDDDAYDRRRRLVDETDEFREASERENDDGFESMARLDDPSLGVAVELVGGLLMVDSARGDFSDNRPALGVRATYEFGRALKTENETWRQGFIADLRWIYGSLSDGTDFIKGDTRLHYFTLAPAWVFRFGESDFGFFVQAGGGLAYQNTSITVGEDETKVNGLKPVLQYGLGIRGRPGRSARFMFRIEATGLRRGYANDFFLGGSAGVGF
ncbi:hypothetical protein D7X30_18205 [Corallococcus sp. AB011P]|uniref:hypothetical protein n=1 Tax=Corallococcus sp. AB011P TaxID=2316735 RepID=UPI000EA3FC62|nr:hypothetical protein [Corallococcus sp. AB011P]RKG57453.1 hypothetical protein D7X30_18205 [Corallococcus sp. AB011P]